MPRPPQIVSSVPPWPEGVQRVRELAAGGTVRLADPDLEAGAWPIDLIREGTVLLCEVPPANVTDMPSLEWIQLGSAGYEQLRGMPLRARGVRVTNASGANDVPIAEWCITMMVMFERDFRRLLDNQRAHIWDRDARFQSELRGRRAGIIGYGNIGREVGRVCRCLGLESGPWTARPSARGPTATRRPAPETPRVFCRTGSLSRTRLPASCRILTT